MAVPWIVIVAVIALGLALTAACISHALTRKTRGIVGKDRSRTNANEPFAARGSLEIGVAY